MNIKIRNEFVKKRLFCLKNLIIVEKRKPGDKKWSARISYRRKRYCLGRYSTKEEAARVRDLKALEFFGKSAKLNFPIEDYK